MNKTILFVVLLLVSHQIGAQTPSISKDSLTKLDRFRLREITHKIELGNATAEEYCGRGFIHQRMQQYDLALEDFNSALKLDKSSVIALNYRGVLFQEMNQTDKAIKDFENVIKLQPSNVDGYKNLAKVYSNQKDFEAAIDVLERLVKMQPNNPAAYSARAAFFTTVGRFQDALDDLDKAVEVSGNAAAQLIERAKFKNNVIFDDLGAVEDCNLAIQQKPSVAEYYYQRSRPLYDLADFAAVVEDCEKALELDPKHVNALIMKANVSDIYKFYDDARILYEKAIQISPDEHNSYKQLSLSEFAQGNKKSALSTLESYMKRGNFHPEITELHGKIAADLKQFDTSIADFSTLVEKYPENPVYYFLRGIVKDSLNNHEAACDDMVLADKLGSKEAHQYLRDHCKSRLSAKLIQVEDMRDEAFRLERAGKDKEAIAIYSDLIKIVPDSSSFYYYRGKAKRRLEDHTGAIEDYLKAIEIDGSRVEYTVSLAVSYSYIDKVEEAIKEYRKAIKTDPRYAMSYYNLGGIYAKDKKYKKAIELYETSLIYSPKYTLAMMALGDCYLEMNELDLACEWYKRAEAAGETKAFGKRVRTCR